MQLYHPENAKEIMDSLGHVPLNGKIRSDSAVGPPDPGGYLKQHSHPAVAPPVPPGHFKPPSDPAAPHFRLPSDPAVGPPVPSGLGGHHKLPSDDAR